MRTTLDISEDVLAAARAIARRERTTLGQTISNLARAGLTGPAPEAHGTDSFLGFTPLPPKPGVLVTDETVCRLREDEGI